MARTMEGKCQFYKGTCCLHPLCSTLRRRQQVPADQYV